MKSKVLFSALTLAYLFSACGENQSSPNTHNEQPVVSLSPGEEQDLLKQSQNIFKPLPAIALSAENELNDAKYQLGKMLYYDSRLSKTGKNSCNSCHNLATYGVDNKATSTGDEGKNGDRNSPTTLNAAFHHSQFWDGRAKNVEEQAGMPILNPIEMAIPSEAYLVERLAAIPMYQKAFKAAFPNESNPITYNNMRMSIAAFERMLTTPCRFDNYLQGNMQALRNEEKHGLSVFIKSGCITCHNGPLLGGNAFKKFGQETDYHALTNSSNADEGRKKVTNNAADKDVFKVPSLRNIAKTHPYFHDGSVSDLNKAISIMGKTQLNKNLTDEEISAIASFLQSLTGSVPEDALKIPEGVSLVKN